MSNVAFNFIIPAAQKAVADLICNELGYPEKGMFVAEVREGDPPPLGDPDPRPLIGYISSGTLDSESPTLAVSASDMLAAVQARVPDTTVTLADCTQYVTWIDRTSTDYMGPFPRKDFVISETKGIPTPTAWVTPMPSGYALDATASNNGLWWRNLIPNNLEEPMLGADGWRRIWS